MQAEEKRKADLELYDHRKLGKQLDYFLSIKKGPGFFFFHPKGTIVLNELKIICVLYYKKQVIKK